MTSTVVITAHPGAPNMSVTVSKHRMDDKTHKEFYVIAPNATFTTYIADGDVLQVEETPMRVCVGGKSKEESS